MDGAIPQFAAMARLMARGLTARRSAADPELPRRRPAVDRRIDPVEPARIADYLRATGGEAIPAGPDAALPPLFPATWETRLALELLASLDPPLPLSAIVHAESEIVRVRPLPPGEPIRCRVDLERAEPIRRGVRLTLRSRNWNAAGQLCTEGTAVYLARRPAPPDARREPEAVPEACDWQLAERWRIAGDAGRRYARVSGDYNPIHLWPWTARAFGFRRPILHGWCTAARVAHALVAVRLDGDPAALRRLAIRFRAPLPLPATVVLDLAEDAREKRFRVTDERGETVYAEGRWAGDPSPPSERDRG